VLRKLDRDVTIRRRRGTDVGPDMTITKITGDRVHVGRDLDPAQAHRRELRAARARVVHAEIKINTSPTDFFPVKQMQLMRSDGMQWVLFGDMIG